MLKHYESNSVPINVFELRSNQLSNDVMIFFFAETIEISSSFHEVKFSKFLLTAIHDQYDEEFSADLYK